MTTLRVALSAESFREAAQAVRAYKRSFPEKIDRFIRELADIGLEIAQSNFDLAREYLLDPQYELSVEKTDSGYRLCASGRDVAFIEFGAGVHYNGSESYPGTRSPGIVGIGEYGKGLGKRDFWVYRKDSLKVGTHGNPALAPMYQGSEAMRDWVLDIAREVFRD